MIVTVFFHACTHVFFSVPFNTQRMAPVSRVKPELGQASPGPVSRVVPEVDPILPKSVKIETFRKFECELKNWIAQNQEVVANEFLIPPTIVEDEDEDEDLVDGKGEKDKTTGSPVPTAFEVYSAKTINANAFNAFFRSLIVERIFKASFENCSQCRTDCPVVMATIAADFSHALNNVGMVDATDKIGIDSLCMETLCPATFNSMTCGTWRFEDGERQAALFAAAGTALLLVCMFCLATSVFGG